MYRQKTLRKWSLTLLILACCCHLSLTMGQECLSPLVIKGKKLFDSSTGQYIPIKGIDYYPRPNAGELSTGGSRDFTSDAFEEIWSRDVEQFKELGINTVRIYAVDPGESHDGFMCALQNAGIYAIVGLAAQCKDCSVTKDAAPDCYSQALKTRGQYIINVFSKYPNVIGFSAGNEINHVVPMNTPEKNAPCQKRFIRDMRAYIASCNMRPIPVGLVMADTARQVNAHYYNCRSTEDELENAEWYGLNVYLHCNGADSDPQALAGYQSLLRDLQSFQLTIPVMLTEFGCLNPSFPTIDGYQAQRNFLQVQTIFSPQYSSELAGGFVFEYSTEEVNSNTNDPTTASPWPFTTFGEGNYGVGYFEPEDCNDEDVPCAYVRFPQFDTLANAYNAINTSFEPSLDEYTPTVTELPQCPEQFPALDQFTWPSGQDFYCPPEEFNSFVCPNTPADCLPTEPTMAPSSDSTTMEPTLAPSMETDKPSLAVVDTEEPTTAGDLGDTFKPTAMEMTEKPTNIDTDRPTQETTTTPDKTPVPTAPPIAFAPTVRLDAASSSAISLLYGATTVVCMLMCVLVL